MEIKTQHEHHNFFFFAKSDEYLILFKESITDSLRFSYILKYTIYAYILHRFQSKINTIANSRELILY